MKFVTCDGSYINEENISLLGKTIQRLLEDCETNCREENSEVTLPFVTLSMVAVLKDPSPQTLVQYISESSLTTTESLCALLNAANFLDNEAVLLLAGAKLAGLFNVMTPTQIATALRETPMTETQRQKFELERRLLLSCL